MQVRNKSLRLVAAGIVLASLLAIAAAMTASANEGNAWRLGTWKTAQTIQPFFYKQFLPAGVAGAQVFPFTNPADQKAALLAGSLDMCGTTLAHAIASASRGEPVVVVAALCNKCSALVVAKDGPVQEVKDLKGKKIGYVPGTMHEILLRETLLANGLDPLKDVELVRVDFFDMGTALMRGGIDAFLSGEPFPSLATHEGYGRILAYPYYDESVGDINAGMLVRKDAIEQHPELVQQMVNAHADATRYLKEHKKEWLDAAAAFGTNRDVLELAAPNMALTWDMDAAFVQRVKALGKRMLALGVIEQEPDYDSLIDLRFVKRYKQEP